jgi:protocatechuate 3,4-dioxygenase beta subunit
LRPFDRLRASCGLHSFAASRQELSRASGHGSALIILFLFVTFILLLSASSAAGQAASPAHAASTFRISGAVVNALSGEIVRNAAVRIGKSETGDALQSVTTGEDGGFRFEGLAAGKYWLRAQARGFADQAFEEHGGFSTGIVTGGKVDAEHLMFQLHPGASIAGQIVDESDEPVRDGQVMLYRRQMQEGREVTNWSAGMGVNDEGRYKFKDLAPGTYFVAVQAKPWYAQDPRVSRAVRFEDGAAAEGSANAANEPEPSAADRALDVAYPVTYYPGATEAGAASPVVLKEGDRATADVRLMAVPALRVRVNRPTVGEEPVGANVMYRIFDGPEMPLPSQSMVTQKGEIEVGGIAPGDYELRVQSYGQNREMWTEHLTLSTDAEVGVSERPESATVKGVVKMESGALRVQQWFVRLRKIATGEMQTAQVSEKGEFEFPTQPVLPGTYEVSVENTQDARVSRITASGAKVMGQSVQIPGAGAVALTITLRQGLGRVNGTVLREGKGAAGTMVVLVPQDARNNLPLLRRDQSDLDGTFSLLEVLPGKYTVVAVQHGWDMDWMDARVLDRYLKRGTTVEVRGDGVNEVKVEAQ